MTKPFPALCCDCVHSKPEASHDWVLRCQHPKVNAKDPWALASATTGHGSDCREERAKTSRFINAQCGQEGKLWESRKPQLTQRNA